MEALVRELLDTNRMLRLGMDMIVGGQEAGYLYLVEHGVDATRPKNLVDAIEQAEAVARIALGHPGPPEWNNTMLRRVLLRYGDHERTCPRRCANAAASAECECDWDNIQMGLTKDSYEGQP